MSKESPVTLYEGMRYVWCLITEPPPKHLNVFAYVLDPSLGYRFIHGNQVVEN